MLPLHLFHCCKNWKTFLFFVWGFFFVWFGCCTKRTELLALNEVKLKGMESGQQAGKEKHKHLEKKIASNMNDCSDNFSPPNPDRCLRLHSFWLWNMNADYLACLAMKLLCFVFSSRGGEGSAEGLGEGGSLCACWGHRDTIVWRALRGNREGELGRWEGERERESKSLDDPTNFTVVNGRKYKSRGLPNEFLMSVLWIEGVLFENEQCQESPADDPLYWNR